MNFKSVGDYLLLPAEATRSISLPLSGTGAHLLGHGVAEYADVCLRAFQGGHNVGFLRQSQKGHGLRLMEEGCHLYTHQDNHHADNANTLTLTNVSTLCVSDLAHIIKAHVRIAEGSYLLSSGVNSASYIDTIPAVTSYVSLQAVFQILCLLTERPDIVVAPPYGGVALGVFLGLSWGVDVAIPQRSDIPCVGLVNRLNREAGSKILVVDDFLSTGATARRVLRGTREEPVVFAVCRLRDSSATESSIAILESCGPTVDWSPELAGLAAINVFRIDTQCTL